MKEKRWTVYCHTHVESGRKYIGLTSQTMLARWNQHVSKSQFSKGGRWHFPNAIRKHGPEAFSHNILEICDTLEEANAAEERHICDLDTRNPERGFNLAPGGDHTPHPIRKNPWDDPEYRARACAAARARWDRPEYRAKKCASSKALWDDPTFRQKVSQSIKEAWQDPAYQLQMSAISKEIQSRPEVKEKVAASARGRQFSPETRKKISDARIGKKSSPETISKLIEFARHRWTPETRDAHSLAALSAWSDPDVRARAKASNRSSDPEVRQKISASLSGHKLSDEARERRRDRHRRAREAHPDHHICKRHGSVHLADCYRVVRSNGHISYRCKLCVIYCRDRRKNQP